jgi:hypothetical protein
MTRGLGLGWYCAASCAAVAVLIGRCESGGGGSDESERGGGGRSNWF